MTDKHEANKALEALAVIETDFCMGIDHRAISDEGIHEELQIVRAALTRLSELEPIIQELVEARGKVKFAEIEIQYINNVFTMTEEAKITGQPKELLDFIALAANRIAKIGETDA